MIINRGTPQYEGRYACYLPGVTVATVIRVWLINGIAPGWYDNERRPIAGKVAGWIGPLPPMPENSASNYREFDL